MKTRKIFIIICLIMTKSLFSQTTCDTFPKLILSTTDSDTLVLITTDQMDICNQVMFDLISKTEENQVLMQNDSIYREIEESKNQIIKNQESIINNKNSIIDNKDAIISKKDEKFSICDKQNARLKRRNKAKNILLPTASGIGFVVGFVVGIYALNR